MADIYSAECLEGFCSQCDVPSCACLHHLEDEEPEFDYDEDFDDEDEDDYDEETEDCGMTRDGNCTAAGSEACEFECPFNNW